MKLTVTVGIASLVALALLTYGVIATNPGEKEIAAKTAELTRQDERQAVQTDILEDERVRKVETYKVFGPRPLSSEAADLNRPNPFEARR